MAERILKVTALFEVHGRGVVAITDKTYETLPQGLKLKTGAVIEFRGQGCKPMRTTIVGIEHCDPWSPKHDFAFLLPREVRKSDVPLEAEVWLP
jgi:hypothetical protein